MAYCMYLRKSRADLEAEAHGEGETLARHEKALLELAKKQKLNIKNIYREVVSGETIASRPIMQKLLTEVEQGLWDGVIVMEVERLARGDTIDQGAVAQAFKFSNTLIITPAKTYNPNDEFDEEYFEFGLFMSRREYKTINRRLQRGRLASVMEGKYVGNIAPYGYRRVKIENDKGYTLEPHDQEADVVKLMFDLYVNGEKTESGTERLGASLVANKLNELGIKPRKADAWMPTSVRDILKNPVYIGKIRWNHRAEKKSVVDGEVVKQRPINDDVVIVDGLHEGIIDEETFYHARDVASSNSIPRTKFTKLRNPLAGLVKCGKCGRAMTRRPNSAYPDLLICTATHCANAGSQLDFVEDAVLEILESWMKEYNANIKTDNSDNNLQINVLENQLKEVEENIKDLKKQMNATYDFLEQGIYTTDVFLERSQIINERLEKEKPKQRVLQKQYTKESGRDDDYDLLIPEVENVLNIYRSLPNASEKNKILKKVIREVVYVKKLSARYKGVDPKDFTITVYPKFPKS